jgi:alkylhydroperoxidase/carboxymuconolactone decarboxylase family protein YurZ
LFSELLTRKDLSHLLLSDIESMMDKMAEEFPDMIKVSSIGKTWEGRDIRVLELDARNKLNQ